MLVERVRALETRDGAVTTQVASVTAEIEELKTKLASANGEKDALLQALDTLQLRKTALEEQVRSHVIIVSVQIMLCVSRGPPFAMALLVFVHRSAGFY